MASITTTPPRSAAAVPAQAPSTVTRPDDVEVPEPLSPERAPAPAAAGAPGEAQMLQPLALFPAAAAVPKKWKPYTGGPVQSAFVGQMSVYSALEGDIDPMPEETERAALARPVKPSEPRTNDDSIYGVAPAAVVLASLSAAPAAVPAAVPAAAAAAAPAPQGGKRRATGRRSLLSGPRRTARRRAFSRNRRYTYPQLI